MAVFDEVLALAKQKGIFEVIDIPISKIVVSDWVFEKARYCSAKINWSYPPFSGGVDKSRKILREYKKAIVFIGKSSGGFRESIIELEHELSNKGYYKSFALINGPCDLCDFCPESKCSENHMLRPSFESWGIDLIATIKRLKKNFDISGTIPPVGIILLE